MKSIDSWLAAKMGLPMPLDKQQLERRQMDMVRRTVACARENSPFYRQLYSGIETAALRTPADMAALPLISASDICTNGFAMSCIGQAGIARIVSLPSSGSSGQVKRILFSQQDLDETVDFFEHGMAPIADMGGKALILMPCETPNGIGSLLAEGLSRLGASPIRYGSIEDCHDAARILESSRPSCVIGMPAQVLRLAHEAPSFPPRSVLLSADQVPHALVARIEELWGCAVFVHYGMTETGYGCAVQCEAGEALHIRHDSLLVEVIDPSTGAQMPCGRQGEIVVTTLGRTAMPLIRYRTGDAGCLVDTPCPCGSETRRLAGIVSRRYAEGADSSVITGQGGSVFTLADLDELMFACPRLLDYRVRLNAPIGNPGASPAVPGRVACRTRTGSSLTLAIEALGITDADARSLGMRVREAAGGRLNATVCPVGSLAANNKKRVIVRNLGS